MNQEKPKYCATCEEEIPLGKEIKVYQDPAYYSDGGGWWGWGGWGFPWPGRYEPDSPRAVYYLCPTCYKAYERKKRIKEKRRWRSFIFFWIFIILFMIMSFIFTGWMFREWRKR